MGLSGIGGGGMKRVYALTAALASACVLLFSLDASAQPTPLVAKGQPVEWFFVYKFNTRSFPQCSNNAERACPFGGKLVDYKSGFGQQYVVATNLAPQLKMGGGGCLGDTEEDPVGATFEQIYDGSLNYVVWNDQFYNDPKITGCGASCSGPWGHSKGVLAWDEKGNGLVLQVTTPSWPGAGNKSHPRTDGNSLGCVTDPNVVVAQHFFASKLTPEDVMIVLKSMANASVVTNPKSLQIVKNGGPPELQKLVSDLGKKSTADELLWNKLSNNIHLISKPSAMGASPWHLVSSTLGSVDLLVASWWNKTDIPDTVAHQKIDCWPEQADWKAPGAVVNARTGHWESTSFSLLGIGSPSGNHAKIAVSTSGSHPYAIFGDMNQEGALSGNCSASQNGRGGMFFVIENQALHDGVLSLISNGPPKAPKP